MPAPVINTQRLRLRPMQMDDLGLFWQFYKSPRARYMHRPESKAMHWYGFSSEVGSWELQGHGSWVIEHNGAAIGQVALSHPPHWPEPELGWLLWHGEGQGYAYEAAKTARDYACQNLSFPSLVSYIHAGNARSIALATRLGAVPDPDAASLSIDDIVYRHPMGRAA